MHMSSGETIHNGLCLSNGVILIPYLLPYHEGRVSRHRNYHIALRALVFVLDYDLIVIMPIGQEYE